jgi:hypothetical protein
VTLWKAELIVGVDDLEASLAHTHHPGDSELCAWLDTGDVFAAEEDQVDRSGVVTERAFKGGDLGAGLNAY